MQQSPEQIKRANQEANNNAGFMFKLIPWVFLIVVASQAFHWVADKLPF